MANKNVKSISLKALLDKKDNKIIFVESDESFTNVLFSFLTMPMGTIIKLIGLEFPMARIGCMNNLYKSVQNLSVSYFRTEACKTMLLHPRSEAENHCRNLKVIIDNSEPTELFFCPSVGCTLKHKLVSHYKGALCKCGKAMDRIIPWCDGESENSVPAEDSVFVKVTTRLLISDDLKVKPLSTAASLPFLSKHGVIDWSSIEQRTFNVGVHEVLKLLELLFVSESPLTETFLKHERGEQSCKVKNQWGSFQSPKEVDASNEEGKICVKLLVSKSRNCVCYAEGGEDFIDLLFSFLTLPLGYIVKELQRGCSMGCIDHLYTTVQELDAKFFLKPKAVLVSPKVAPGFHWKSLPLGVEEASNPLYYIKRIIDYNGVLLSTRLTKTGNNSSSFVALKVMDPKSNYKEVNNVGGFLKGPTLFMVTDDLVVTPVSPISGISILNQLKVTYDDLEERVVQVGIQEVACLLAASFMTESALTNTFIKRELKREPNLEPKQEY